MILTDEELDATLQPLGMARYSTLMGPADVNRIARIVESAVLRKLRERPADAWFVRRLDAPLYPIMFMHRPVDALADPQRSVQELHIIPTEVNE